MRNLGLKSKGWLFCSIFKVRIGVLHIVINWLHFTTNIGAHYFFQWIVGTDFSYIEYQYYLIEQFHSDMHSQMYLFPDVY